MLAPAFGMRAFLPLRTRWSAIRKKPALEKYTAELTVIRTLSSWIT